VKPQPIVFALSDATGATAEQAVRSALAQFGHETPTRVRLFPHVLDPKALDDLMVQAKSQGALVVYTLVGPDLRRRVKELADAHEVPVVDLLGGLVNKLALHLGRAPLSVPGLGHETDAEYFRRIEAVEFAVKNDDGKEPQNLRKADIVFVGISRTSKTPLSNYIAQRGYKVANVPLVVDVPLPRELEQVDARRVFGLLIDPSVLVEIRRARMDGLGMPADSAYGDLAQVRREVAHARRLFQDHPDWTVIDITRKAVEETASTVLEHYRARFEAGGNGGNAKRAPDDARAPRR
jgi:regulator of PEP synthase PpsR (kinase-PPPase family)